MVNWHILCSFGIAGRNFTQSGNSRLNSAPAGHRRPYRKSNRGPENTAGKEVRIF